MAAGCRMQHILGMLAPHDKNAVAFRDGEQLSGGLDPLHGLGVRSAVKRAVDPGGVPTLFAGTRYLPHQQWLPSRYWYSRSHHSIFPWQVPAETAPYYDTTSWRMPACVAAIEWHAA